MSSPEELIIEESSLGPGPVVSKLGDLGVEGPEGVSSDQQGRALPSRQTEVCLEAGFSTSMLRTLVIHGIRAPMIGPFRVWKPTIIML